MSSRTWWMAAVAALVLGLSYASAAAAAKRVLELSEAGRPVPAGTEVGFAGSISPEGREGTAQFGGAGPLEPNGAAVDRITARAAYGGQTGGWLVDGEITQLTLTGAGKARIEDSGLAISPDEVKPVEPPPPPLLAVGGQECWYRLPGKLAGTFPTTGLAVISGHAVAKPSSSCTKPGFTVAFTLTIHSEQEGRLTLETAVG